MGNGKILRKVHFRTANTANLGLPEKGKIGNFTGKSRSRGGIGRFPPVGEVIMGGNSHFQTT